MTEIKTTKSGVKIQVRNAKRKMAVDAIQSGEAISDVARMLSIPHRTLFSWLSAYRHGGHHALLESDRSGRPRKVNGEVMEWLYKAITLGDPRQFQLPFCLWTLNIIRAVLKKEHKVELSKSGVSRLLGHLGLSPQRPIYKSYKRNPDEMKCYLNTTFPGLRELALKTGAQIFFVDESAIRSDSHRGTTWGKIGETPEVENSGDRFSLKLISAVSPRGDMHFTCFEGFMNSARFIEFLKKLLQDAECPIIVIADNASYHNSAEVNSFVATQNGEITIANLPRYSPEVNPDEQVWNHAKARLSKLFIITKKEFKRSIVQIMKDIKSTSMLIKSFFQMKNTKYAAI